MKKNAVKRLWLLFVGVASGLVNGFFGAGGGLIIVPMLTKLLNKNSKTIHATTLACVLSMSFSAAVVYFVKNIYDLSYIFPCLIGGIVGGVTGTFVLKKLKNKIIDLIFSLVLILAGVSMLIL